MMLPKMKRVEILTAVKNKDVESLCKLAKNTSEGSLAETITEFNKHQFENLWDGIFEIGMSALFNNEDDEKNLSETCVILQCITTLAYASISALKQRQDSEEERTHSIAVPKSLQETAVILHGILPSLNASMDGLKNEMSRLFEKWWVGGFPGCEQLMGNTLLYLLTCCTDPKSLQVSVARLWAVHRVLSAMDLCADEATSVVTLLSHCVHHNHFVNTGPGSKFLIYLFTLGPELAETLHKSIKTHLPTTPKSWHSKYGEIYFRAWHKMSEEHREKMEQSCIQDLMYCGIHAQRKGHNSLADILFRVLNSIHKQKTQRGAESMLSRLYKPILWRSLLAANSDVRVNAATLLFDVFPLQDPNMQHEEADNMLQKQFDLMHSLLSDPVADVRLAAVKGVGHVLGLYWELIPAQVITSLVTSLAKDLAYDISSPAVRTAVIKVMHDLCDNPLCITMLKTVLPELCNFIHDNSEKVRIAMVDLLLKIKGLRAIKFWSVVPIGHILSRLEVDVPVVVRKLMRLIYPSFVPVDRPPAEQVERCVALIKDNPAAARQFFIYLPQHLGTAGTAEYIITLCKYLLETARQRQQQHDHDNAEEPTENTGSAKTKRPRHQRAFTGGKKKYRGSDGYDDEEDDVEDTDVSEAEANETQASVSAEGDVCAVSRGLVEAVYLMYFSILSKQGALEREGLAKKISVTVRQVMIAYPDQTLNEVLVSLAGLLPAKALPLVSQNLIKRLKRATTSVVTPTESTPILKSLVLSGNGNSVLEMITDSLDMLLMQMAPVAEKSNEKQGKKKKAVGFSVAEAWKLDAGLALDWLLGMMEHSECQPMLLGKHKEELMSIQQSMEPITKRLNEVVISGETTGLTASVSPGLLVKTFVTYLRLSTFLCITYREKELVVDAEIDESVKKSIGKSLQWVRESLVATLIASPGGEKEEMCCTLTESVMKSCRCLLMIGQHHANTVEQITDLCMTLLKTDLQPSLTRSVLACVYQISQLSGTGHVAGESNESDWNLKMANACLCQFLKALKAMLEPEKESRETKVLELFTAVSAVVGEIVVELTRPGNPVEMVKTVVSACLDCVVGELRGLSGVGELAEDEGLPPVTALLLSTVSKRASNKRMLIHHLQDRVESEDIADIHHLHSLLHLTATLRTGDAVPVSLERSLGRALACLVPPGEHQEKEFRELKKQMECKLSSWAASGGDEEIGG